MIELMIVVAVIGILASVAIPKFADLIIKSRDATTRAHLGSLRCALSVYYADNDGTYPDALDILVPKYLTKIPLVYTGHHDKTDVVTYGSGT